MSYTIKVSIADYSNLTWSIDVLYKNQYILTLTRKEFEELKGMLAVSTTIFDKKYNVAVSPGNCDSKYPFEVNCHLYNAQKLTSLKNLLIKQYDSYLDTLVVATERYENEHELPILKNSASSNQEFEEYLQYLNNDKNVLKFVLKELNVEKRIDLRFIKNIELIYDEYIEDLNKEKKEFPKLYEDPESHANKTYEFVLEFKKKYELMMKKIENLN